MYAWKRPSGQSNQVVSCFWLFSCFLLSFSYVGQTIYLLFTVSQPGTIVFCPGCHDAAVVHVKRNNLDGISDGDRHVLDSILNNDEAVGHMSYCEKIGFITAHMKRS